MLRFDDADRARLALRGEDRVRFLHGMVTCDVEKLAPGTGSRAAMLSVKGRLLADLVVYATEDELLLSMEAQLQGKVHAWLDKHIVMDDVELQDRTAELVEVALFAEGAFAAAAKLGAAVEALPAYGHVRVGAVLVARDSSLGGEGVRFIGPADAIGALDLGGDPLTVAEHEVLRVEAGRARYGVDLDEERLIVEANLDDAISFDKGCYLGQEVVVRATTRGRVNRKLVGLVVDGEGAVEAHAKLGSAAQADAGLTASSVVSARMGGPIALAYVHRAALEAGAPLSVLGTDRRAIAVELPFDLAAVSAARLRLRDAAP